MRTDSLGVGNAIQTLVAGTEVIKLVDRDSRTPDEVADLMRLGVRVLSRRHLESYLLDDEVLESLCRELGQTDKAQELLEAKSQALVASIDRGNDPDDMKSIAGSIQVSARRILGQPQLGSTAQAFMRDILAPLLPGTSAYYQLRTDIFPE